MTIYCCEKFKSAANGAARNHCQYGITQDPHDGTWTIDSCCGGCNAAQDITHCPWCGSPLPTKAGA